jgi:hypothetical protein
MTLMKPHNIGTHLKGIETSVQVVPLFLKSFQVSCFWVSYISFWNFLKLPSVFKGSNIFFKLSQRTIHLNLFYFPQRKHDNGFNSNDMVSFKCKNTYSSTQYNLT